MSVDETQGTIKKSERARFLLPFFLCAQIFIERETSEYEAGPHGTQSDIALRNHAMRAQPYGSVIYLYITDQGEDRW